MGVADILQIRRLQRIVAESIGAIDDHSSDEAARWVNHACYGRPVSTVRFFVRFARG